jgi:hypothetical protein
MTTKITSRVAEAVHSVSRGRALNSISSTLWECVGLGLLTVAPSGDQEVTEAGKVVVAEFLRKKEAARVKSRTAARARRGVMTSLGLTRTRDGGWE